MNKTIYYCWFGGSKPQKVLDCIQNWKEKLPIYQIVEINENNKELFDAKKECQNNLWFKTVWENKMWAYVADYARLKVLYEKGGIYFDTDITVERDITELVDKNKLILGWEDNQSINIALGVIFVRERNPLIKEMLDFYDEKIWHSNLYTIPQIVTHVIRKHYELNPSTKITENDEILILPQEYFYPTSFRTPNKLLAECVTENTYTIHWWHASWTKPNILYFLNNKNKENLEDLIHKCFNTKIYIDNIFIHIEKTFTILTVNIDMSYIFRFKYLYEYGKRKQLLLYILGIKIPLWKVKHGANNGK